MSTKLTFDARLTDIEKETCEPDGFMYRKDLPAGVGHWYKDANGVTTTLRFTCPCGCGMVCGCPVTAAPYGHGWQWNGSHEVPTLSPSIRLLGKCGWHGYLQNGNFNPC